jgi:hypothetical protein
MPANRNIVRQVVPNQNPITQLVIREASLRILLMKSIREMIETRGGIYEINDQQLKDAIDVILNSMEEIDDDDDDDDVRLRNRLTRFMNDRTLFVTIIDEIERRQPQQPQQQQHSGRRRSSKASR